MIAIDLFSDSNCVPCQPMRQFMTMARVGNKAAGKYQTVNLLIKRVCNLHGIEAGVFLASGTICKEGGDYPGRE
jgi:threonine aldolase